MNYKQVSYKRLGNYIKEVSHRNSDLSVTKLMGINIEKFFMPSVANVIGTDLSTYKVVKKNQFACNLMHVGRDEKIPVALNQGEAIIVSPAYFVFEIKDSLLPEYLQIVLKRPEFDRNAWFHTDGDVRGGMDKEGLKDLLIPIPRPTEQQRIVNQYNVIQKRIENNKKTIAKLEETAQAIYRKMFLDNIDPENLPDGWRMGTLSDIATVNMGQSPSGDTLNKKGEGILFYQGCSDFGIRFVAPRVYTTAPTKYAEPFDILISVRAPVGSLNITKERCCIGRGLAAIRSKNESQSFVLYTLKNQSQAFTIADGDGSVFGSINKNGLNELSICIPTESLINAFNNLVSPMDDLIVQCETEINILSNMLNVLL